MTHEDRDAGSDGPRFAYVADGWTTRGERFDASVFVIEDDGRLRSADDRERALFYSRYGSQIR